MASTARLGVRPRPALPVSDRAFNALLLAGSALVLAMIAVLGISLAKGAMPAAVHFGWRFLFSSEWDPIKEKFGALPFIFGTLASSALALLFAIPVGVGSAIFLAEIAPAWLSRPLSFLVELVAAVPSVIYGMWGLFVIVPILAKVEASASSRWPGFFLFSGAPIGIGLLAAGVILAIMILPIIAAISREAILAVPRSQSEAGLSLGATRWETLAGPVLKYARKGIIGAVILALGRALGETMAVTMVIGNSPQIKTSIFESAYSMSGVIANEFAEATGKLSTASLVEIAFLLLAVTILVNAMARLMIWGAVASTEGGKH